MGQDVAKTSLAEIIWYGRQHVRRRSEARILAIQPSLDTLPRHVNIPAGDTVGRIQQLMRWGYAKSLISRDALGNKSVGLQIRALRGTLATTTVRTAVNIRDFYALIVEMRRVWQEGRGAIPKRQYVYWKSELGRRPAGPTANKLELRPFALTYDYNVIWPKELREVSALNNRLRKLYRAKRREENENEKKYQRSA